MNTPIEIGIIGGSGVYNMPELVGAEEVPIRTPYGKTSDSILKGTIADVPVVFIPRHGRGHVLTPSEVPYAANIYAMKALGVKYIISVSAAGSLRDDYAPGDICIPDQLVDWTKGLRQATFFGDGVVGHIGVADPFSPELSELLYEAAQAANATVHPGGAFVTIEGPRFSTRAESETFRQLGYSIVGMTTTPEAFLAAEAEIAYAVFAHITDYDVWREDDEAVSAQAVMDTLDQNTRLAQQAILEAVPRVAAVQEPMQAHNALQGAIMTTPEKLPPPTIEKLRVLLGKYFN